MSKTSFDRESVLSWQQHKKDEERFQNKIALGTIFANVYVIQVYRGRENVQTS